MDPGRTPSHRMDIDDVRVSISICAGHGLHGTPGNDETSRKFKLRFFNSLIYNGGSDERTTRNEDKATTFGHTMDAGVVKPTYALDIGGNRIQTVHRGT